MATTAMPQTNNRSLWPYAIVATFVLFAGYIGYMVKQAMSTSVDLVSKDYYQKEIAYEQHMNTLKRTAQLSEAVQMQYSKATQDLTITLPQELAGKQVAGTVHFFRPSDVNLDFKVPLTLNSNLEQSLSTAKLAPGYWKVLLNFTAGDEAYFQELEITVAK